jgi:hypothetical protein
VHAQHGDRGRQRAQRHDGEHADVGERERLHEQRHGHRRDAARHAGDDGDAQEGVAVAAGALVEPPEVELADDEAGEQHAVPGEEGGPANGRHQQDAV